MMMILIRASLAHSFKCLVIIFRYDDHPTTLQETIQLLQNFSHGQRVFLKQVCTVTSLILVMPATNASSEQ